MSPARCAAVTSTALAVLLVAPALLAPAPARADAVLDGAKQAVAAATAPAARWGGPTTGPKAVAGKLIVYVAGDMRNGGIQGVADGVKQAAARIGWTLRILDGQGSVAGIQSAFSQAVALKPAGIVVGGYDAAQNAGEIHDAVAKGIRIVAWHGGPVPGPMLNGDLFTNVTSDNHKVAEVAADYAIAQSNGRAAVVVFADSAYAMALAKGNWMRDTVAKCSGCKVLAFEDTPLDDTSTRMPPLTTSLIERFGHKWTYGLGINDLYFDYIGPPLTSAGIDPAGPPVNISAGDGSKSAFERIRTGQFQAATVPEPLQLHGWQVVDELNRAFAGAKPSLYVTPVHLVTKANIDQDGGQQDIYDPANGYRDVYAHIWGR